MRFLSHKLSAHLTSSLLCTRRHAQPRCLWQPTRRFRDYLKYSKEVSQALVGKKPVVALETTILTHGMPFPQNIETAMAVEDIIRERGATPATIAVKKGNVHIGLEKSELVDFCTENSGAVKTSRRDLPYVLSKGLLGGTTVSGTMVAAHRAGIPVFVTGGVGGVHRGAQASMDVSSDLTELGRTPVCVVSSGIKSILDIPLTLEYLETQGVCVATYGPTKSFPAFYTHDSGCFAPYNVETARDAAQILDANLSFELDTGMLVAVPIPEEFSLDGAVIEHAIHTAVEEAEQQQIKGKDVTPYILQRVNELTEGKSLQANIALIKKNASVGADIACELAKIRSQSQQSNVGQGMFHFHKHQALVKTPGMEHQRMVVVGGTNVDFNCTFKAETVEPNGGTYPGTVRESFGGVGRNIADCLTRLGVQPLFISAVGNDTHSENFFYNCHHMDLSGVQHCSSHSTACYSAILTCAGELIYGIGDFDIHSQITPEYVSRFDHFLTEAPIVCIDGNIPAETISYICDVCYLHKVPVWFEPTDLRLISKIFESSAWQKLTYISPNLNELRKLNAKLKELAHLSDKEPRDVQISTEGLPEFLTEGVELVQPVLQIVPNVMVTLGKNGVLMCRNSHHDDVFTTRGTPSENSGLSLVHYPVRKAGQGIASIISVSGAGDCLAGSMLWQILQGRHPSECLTTGLLAAQQSLKSHTPVPGNLSTETLSRALVMRWVNMYCTPTDLLTRQPLTRQ